ncbi:MAG: ATP-binding cassette domain-containing protein [Pseudomonadota bacterium]|jgi:ABC-2 type transport system ATP-binding protein|nr:ATP-binding cassette domain-containing protein [Pseudomonadota bacterium]
MASVDITLLPAASEAPLPNPSGGPAPLAVLHEVSKRFGTHTALERFSLSLRAGEVSALLGPDGAGTTTTLKILTVLLAPASGTLGIDGLDPVRKSTAVRRRIGIVFQDASLDQKLSARENRDLHGALYPVPRKIDRERMQRLLELFGLWERRDELVKQYSRRLELARGLSAHPAHPVSR